MSDDHAELIDGAQLAAEQVAIDRYLRRAGEVTYLCLWVDGEGVLNHEVDNSRVRVLLDVGDDDLFATYKLTLRRWAFVAGSESVDHVKLLEQFMEAAKNSTHPARRS